MFKLEITTDNAAFDGDDLTSEIGRVLVEAGNKIMDCGIAEDEDEISGHLYDINGNRVGKWELTK